MIHVCLSTSYEVKFSSRHTSCYARFSNGNDGNIEVARLCFLVCVRAFMSLCVSACEIKVRNNYYVNKSAVLFEDYKVVGHLE